MNIKEPPYEMVSNVVNKPLGKISLFVPQTEFCLKMGKLGCRQSRQPNSAKTGVSLYSLGYPGTCFVGQAGLKHTSIKGWRDGSEVKSIVCSSRGPEFNSQQPHGGSQPSIMRSDAVFWRAGVHGLQPCHTVPSLSCSP